MYILEIYLKLNKHDERKYLKTSQILAIGELVQFAYASA